MIWAKKSEDSLHLLINHIIDVYHTATLLIEKNINIFSNLESFTKENQKIWAAIIGMHDIGKATNFFQSGNSVCDSKKRHEVYSVYILFHYLNEKLQIKPDDLLKSSYFNVIKFIILHHSKFKSINHKEIFLSKHNSTHPIGAENWKKIQYDIIDTFLNSIEISVNDLKKLSFVNISDAAYFSGLMTLADWVGSDINSFPLEGEKYNIKDYFHISKERAEKAINSTGLNVTPNIINDDWSRLFQHIPEPRNLQIVSQNCELKKDSNLIIIEAPTGEGKTEAAFNIAARLCKDKNSGIYVAMPTQATSNGLYKRFEEFLKNADGAEKLNVKLIHGSTFLYNLRNQLTQSEITAPDEDTKSDAFEWFNKGKKAFLAPYGIGTIDQALYSILIVKHFFLRLYSLAGKTVIFDEVHAYDTYMNELLILLVKWLKALKCNVILLSATLPSQTKNNLLNAWESDLNYEENIAYPIMNVVNGSLKSYTFESRFAVTGNNNFKIEFCDFDEDIIATAAEEHYKNGAKVLVIVNKVKRSQNIFNKLNISDKTLFHSRFTSKDRELIENIVLAKYGKGSSDKPSILVSTQIVEQSLDIDFDIIISDLAPIDLLIQRAGRLHRHTRIRPNKYENPKFIIATHEAAEKDLPKINDEKIYAAIILYRTYFALKINAHKWNFHRDFREPVEEVYYPIEQQTEKLFDLNLSEDAKKHISEGIEKFKNETLKAENEAGKVLIHKPEKFDKILSYGEIPLEEEENGKGIIAKTRLGSDTEKLILLFEKDDKYYFDRKFNDEFNVNVTVTDKLTTYKLLQNLISVYSYSAGKYAENQPQWWQKIKSNNKMLKNYRLLIVNETDSIKYDEINGLTI
ncbi:MAG: CRISPR-associated helicase Cas3' [Candidatus Kapabacteria bacterium]|nr:CRISPR-associated helicase Cas3' [Candidatus Kapabacteria bacterium]